MDSMFSHITIKQSDINQWITFGCLAIHYGLVERIVSFNEFHQMADNIAHHLFLQILTYAQSKTPGDLDASLSEKSDQLGHLLNLLAVGSCVHPDVVEAYISGLVDSRIEAFTKLT